MSQNLKHLTILDCSSLRTGPSITRFFQEQGARVIKIESPKRPDPARVWPSVFQTLNEGKEIEFLDLKLPEDQKKFHSLLEIADAIVESYTPTTKVKLGLDSNTIHSINPKVIILSITGFPKNSSRYTEPAHDLNLQAASGMLSLFKEMPGLPLADLFTSSIAINKLLASLYSKNLNQVIHFSFLEALYEVQKTAFAEFKETEQPPIHGNTLVTGKFPCYQIYETLGGTKIALAALEAHYWENFCTLIELPLLIKEQYSTDKAITQTIQNKLSRKPWEEWQTIFSKKHCCIEPILDYSQLKLMKTKKEHL